MEEIKALELDKILEKTAALCSAEPVRQAILDTRPLTEKVEVEKLLGQTGEAVRILASHRPDLYFEDIGEYVDKAKVGAALSPACFLKIKQSISALRSIKSCIENDSECDLLYRIVSGVRTADDLKSHIDKTIESETEVRDSASDKLYSLRRSIMRANARLKEKLDSYTRQSEFSKYLRDNIVTIRGGRYVLPVRSECRSNVKGLIHDVSSSGATVFIEPFAVVEANNELITLKTEEANEVERILLELGRAVVTYSDELICGQEALIECGTVFAKAEYAVKTDSYRPKLNTEGNFDLRGARHPLIDPAKVVPVDIMLSGDRILLISGPNTGGKTVALKTVGLFALMACCGLFLPAKEGSEIAVFNKIYCDIGDSQSIANSLSTFSAHIAKLSEIAVGMDKGSLVLLDEVGDGTDPEEGAALAVAVLKKILKMGSTAVVTTHFNSVKEFAMTCDGIANACMQFDAGNLSPTYRLLPGVTGSSYALEIAERLGLGKDIIEDARNALSDDKLAFDKVIHEAEKLRNEFVIVGEEAERLRRNAANDAAEAQRLKREYENKLGEINENARALIRRQAEEYSDKAEAIIEKIKQELKNANEAALFNARKEAKKLNDGVPFDKIDLTAPSGASGAKLTVGTQVYIPALSQNGVIAGIRGNKAIVAIRSVKTELPLSSLTAIDGNEKSRSTPAADRAPEPENREVMMLGLTVSDAEEQLDRIISDIPSGSLLRIVHGKGTGALGKGVQNYLRKNPRVRSFRYGRYGEGDTGVTIVEIK